ncbi:MAG: DUF1559 domain-containing protein, partial [Planctomycetaceae bacterium]|nr:DUF1559 domain-containing protein [Planctomycetaceae bacterium]
MIKGVRREKMVVRRRGLTLLELIVVISILAILTALLLPSVQRSRVVSQRTQCRNNFHAIGMAMHAYHETYGQFPLAGIVSARTTSEDQIEFGSTSNWNLALLPFLDKVNLFNEYRGDLSAFDPLNEKVVGGVVPSFICPSTPREKNQAAFSMPRGTPVFPQART